MTRRRRVAKGTSSSFVVSDSESEDDIPTPSLHRHVHLDADATGYSARTATFFEAPGSPSKKAPTTAYDTDDVPMPDLIPFEDEDDEYDQDLPYELMDDGSKEPKKRARTASVSACMFHNERAIFNFELIGSPTQALARRRSRQFPG